MNTTLRNNDIVEGYLAGKTITSMALTHGISRQRVDQIVRKAGCPKRVNRG